MLAGGPGAGRGGRAPFRTMIPCSGNSAPNDSLRGLPNVSAGWPARCSASGASPFRRTSRSFTGPHLDLRTPSDEQVVAAASDADSVADFLTVSTIRVRNHGKWA